MNAGLTRFLDLGKQAYAFIPLGKKMSLPRGSVLAEAGKRMDACYYVLSGLIVSVEVDAQGNEKWFQIMGEDSLIGEAFLWEPHILPVTFRVEQNAEVIRIESDVLRRAAGEDPEMATILFRSLSRKFLLSTDEWRNMSGKSVSWRICKLFLMLAEKSGVPEQGRVRIEMEISQQKIAQLLSVNRITVVRVLKQLREIGMVAFAKGRYVLDLDAVKTYVEDME